MLKITTKDGNTLSTTITDSETGQPVGMDVIACDISLRPNQAAKATLLVGLINHESVIGEAQWLMSHPVTRKLAEVSAIEFKDGTRCELVNGSPVVSTITQH